MTRPLTLSTDVLGGFHNAHTEQLLPKTIDSNTRCQGMLVGYQPIRKIHSAFWATRDFSHRRQERRSAPFDLLPKIVVTYLAPGQTGTYGTGWPVGTGTFELNISGTASGGSVLPITYANAPSPSIGVNFFSLDINLTGTPLLPASLVYLPLGGLLIPGATIITSGGVSGSTFTVPTGFPGYLIMVQAAVLDSNALSFSMSNAGVMLTQ